MQFKNIISDGILHEKEEDDISPIIENLKNRLEWLHNLSVDEILDFFGSLGKVWKSEKNKFGTNLKHVGDFLNKENLGKELTIALRGNYHALDEFVELYGDKKMLYHAQPRGLTVHWIAGNVDILGIFSVVQALVTKNVCLIKAPHNYNVLRDLLLSMKDVKTAKISGQEFIKCVALVYVERTDETNQQILSNSADVRIAWGGEEAITTILSLKKRFFTEDIMYGPKYSYAILDSYSASTDATNIAQKLAVDICVFDQYACNSPHTILIESTEDDHENLIPKNFAKELANAMDVVNRLLLPKPIISEKKSMDILSLRAEYDFKGEVFCSHNTDWTVIYSNENGLAEPCFSRVVFVRPIKNMMDVESLNNKKIQSIGLAITDVEKRKKLVDLMTMKGGDRCPNIGTMSLFGSPWDGMFGMDRLVRWITVYNNHS
ncbi:MAG: acyl-CoA reductase [Nitrosopumilaceae archaeon]